MPMFGPGGFKRLRDLLRLGSPAPAPIGTPALLSIDPEGWAGQWNPSYGALPAYSSSVTEFAPDTAPITVPFSAPGYDEDGNATTIARTRTITKRVRKPFTLARADLTPDGNRVATDSFTLQGETSPGVTNNSTKLGYKPVAQHLVRNRRVVGDTAYVQVEAGHWSARNQKQVACVKAWYRSVDGTKATAKVKLSGPKVLAGLADRHSVEGYDGVVPVATWSDGTPIADGTSIIREVEVYPFVGTLIATTVGGVVDAQGFNPWTDYKHTARVAAPPQICVAPTGGVDETVNANGIGITTGLQRVSTDPAVCRANPFATPTSAFNALKAATALTGGVTDGCYINFRAGVHAQGGNPLAGTYQQGGEAIARTDPADAPYSATVTLSGYAAYRQLWLAWEKMSLTKSASASGLMAGGRLLDCKIDGGGFNSSFFNGAAVVDGVEVTNFPAGAAALLHSTAGALMVRGVLATDVQVDGFNLSGSRLRRCALATSTRTKSGLMMNGVSNIGGVINLTANDGAATIEGVVLINVIVTWVTTTTGLLVSASADNNGFDIRHFNRWGLTELGSGDRGRRNEGYDESDGTTRRFNEFWDERSVIAAAAYHKVDVLAGMNKQATITEAECANRTGSWSVTYGVMRRGVFHVTEPNANTGPNFGPGGSEVRAFFGLKIKTLAGRTNSYTVHDPRFVGGYQKAVHWDGTAFVAGDPNATAEDFQLLADSPCIGVLTAAEEPIGFDIGGNARSRGALGAWG